MAPPVMTPRILFRADARPDLGGGHIMRCLSLARALSARGAEIAFATCPGSADLVPALARSGYPVFDAASDRDTSCPDTWNDRADAVFVDLYSSTRADETALRAFAPVIGVIEDLPDRQHDCDLLVDQGFDRTEAAYAGRVPAGTTLLLGPNQCPLRPQFAEFRTRSMQRRRRETSPGRILVAMGLTDLGGISGTMAELARRHWPDHRVDVVVGPGAQSLPGLLDAATGDPRLNVLIDVDDMHRVMSEADFAIGAGGGTALERCVLGLPSFVVVLADNQRPAAEAIARRGAGWLIDAAGDLDAQIAAHAKALGVSELTAAGEAAAALCDGRGAERIADALLARISTARPEAGEGG